MNAYLRAASGVAMTAKCLRTWVATVRMTEELLAAGEGAALKEPLGRVASELGHTPTICRKSYIHPEIIDRHQSGSLAEALAALEPPAPREAIEVALLELLEGGSTESRRAA